jgi:hypothetical protein
MIQLQLFQFDILKHTNLHHLPSAFELHLKPNDTYIDTKLNPTRRCLPGLQSTTAANWTEKMCHILVAKQVRAKTVITRMKYDVLSLWVDKKIAIASADGAIAAENFVGHEGLNVDGVSQLAAVTVRIVRSEARSG